jgi:putative sigma-54 modulation protein
MDIIIQSLGFKAGDQLEGYIRRKLEQLTPQEHIVRATVTLFLGPDRAAHNNYCEIRLSVPGNDHFVKEKNPDFEVAADSAIDKLEKILRKEKQRLIDERHAGNKLGNQA